MLKKGLEVIFTKRYFLLRWQSNHKSSTIGGMEMGRNKHRDNGGYPFKAGFSPKPKKVCRFKVEKLLGSLYLTRPLLEGMNIKTIIDGIVPER